MSRVRLRGCSGGRSRGAAASLFSGAVARKTWKARGSSPKWKELEELWNMSGSDIKQREESSYFPRRETSTWIFLANLALSPFPPRAPIPELPDRSESPGFPASCNPRPRSCSRKGVSPLERYGSPTTHVYTFLELFLLLQLSCHITLFLYSKLLCLCVAWERNFRFPAETGPFPGGNDTGLQFSDGTWMLHIRFFVHLSLFLSLDGCL